MKKYERYALARYAFTDVIRDECINIGVILEYNDKLYCKFAPNLLDKLKGVIQNTKELDMTNRIVSSWIISVENHCKTLNKIDQLYIDYPVSVFVGPARATAVKDVQMELDSLMKMFVL